MKTPFDVVLIETANTCTRKCTFCKFGQERQDASTIEMSQECLERLANQLSTLRYSGRISPFGINEPLLDPRLGSIIKLFRHSCPEAFISLNTNGDLLTPIKFQELFDAGLDAIGISIYENSSLKRLAPYQCLPNVKLIDMRNPHEKLENRGGEVKHKDFTFELVNNNPCLRPSNMLVIRPSGDVVLCCADMYGDVPIGNVMDRSLLDLWFDPLLVKYRSQLRHHRQGLKLCETCSHKGFTSSPRYPLA